MEPPLRKVNAAACYSMHVYCENNDTYEMYFYDIYENTWRFIGSKENVLVVKFRKYIPINLPHVVGFIKNISYYHDLILITIFKLIKQLCNICNFWKYRYFVLMFFIIEFLLKFFYCKI